MSKNKETLPMKLRHISIENYKGIDHLELDFPAPELPGDPDVVVIGSENGLGKTSVLECCALLTFAYTPSKNPKGRTTRTEFFDLLVRAGSNQSKLEADFSDGGLVWTTINKDVIENRIGSPTPQAFSANGYGGGFERNDIFFDRENDKDQDFIHEICGFSSNPVVQKNLLFFHSYRKVLEGNPRLGSFLGGKQPPHNGRYTDSVVSTFKRTALFSMMSNADLFDGPKDTQAETTLETLNQLLEQYADCRFTKLRPTQDDTIELRVQPVGSGESFNFDGLSSGQKEIITTLFLIWYETRNQPKVVLIDEPELHLNSQWHRSFINSLVELAPESQYIIATHSATVMDSVDRSRRILLQRELC